MEACEAGPLEKDIETGTLVSGASRLWLLTKSVSQEANIDSEGRTWHVKILLSTPEDLEDNIRI